MITVDVHEPDEIKEFIEDEGGEYRVESLSTGDFLAGDFIIERKRYGDFIGRITQSERDIWQQVLAMENAAQENDLIPVLLFEGEWAEAMRWSNLTPKEPTMAIGSIMKLGISTVHVMGPRAVAQLMVKFDDGTTHDVGSIRDSPSVPPELMPQHLVEGFPGIGPSRANAILDKFGTAQSVFNAEPDELKTIDGIGDATAQKIFDASRQELPDE